ncbi:MAG: PPC domain-containing protein [Kovacikia sp.]
MNHSSTARSVSSLITFLSLLAVGANMPGVNAQTRIYSPISIAPGSTITDKLTNKDIPTGQGGFARDYILELREGSQLAIDLTSDNFDSIVTLIGSDGATISENDDGPDGSTNSLLFTRITKSGTYFIRVRAFGEVAGGNFRLKVTLLKPVAGEK